MWWRKKIRRSIRNENILCFFFFSSSPMSKLRWLFHLVLLRPMLHRYTIFSVNTLYKRYAKILDLWMLCDTESGGDDTRRRAPIQNTYPNPLWLLLFSVSGVFRLLTEEIFRKTQIPPEVEYRSFCSISVRARRPNARIMFTRPQSLKSWKTLIAFVNIIIKSKSQTRHKVMKHNNRSHAR